MKDEFVKLYDETFDDIYKYVYFKTNSKWDTDDLVGEIFRKAFEKYGTSVRSRKAWLFTIAKNTVTDYYRRKKDIITDSNIENEEYNSSFDDAIILGEELKCLNYALKKLDDDELEIVDLRYFSEVKFKDIGVIINKSESAVKMKSARIINKLKELVNICLEGK